MLPSRLREPIVPGPFMLQTYVIRNGALAPHGTDRGSVEQAVWIDLVRPTREEETLVEEVIGIEVPTREEMREIEPSSRLYVENGARFLTASLVYRVGEEVPGLAAVTFVLHRGRLITIRYEDPTPFQLFCARAGKTESLEGHGGDAVFGGLLDTITDRLADILEKVGDELDTMSHSIFRQGSDDHSRSYKDDMRALGRRGDLTSKARESLVSIGRLLAYLMLEIEGVEPPADLKGVVETQRRDVESLSQQTDYLLGKTQFLLDAVLGMVSVEQNNIIKIFAVLSVVLGPPTLVASVYGMNFKVMPELEWEYGYPYAIVLMVLTGLLPLLYFKWKRWL